MKDVIVVAIVVSWLLFFGDIFIISKPNTTWVEYTIWLGVVPVCLLFLKEEKGKRRYKVSRKRRGKSDDLQN